MVIVKRGPVPPSRGRSRLTLTSLTSAALTLGWRRLSAWVETRKQARQKRVPPGIRSGIPTRSSLHETRSMVTPTLSARRVTKPPRSCATREKTSHASCGNMGSPTPAARQSTGEQRRVRGRDGRGKAGAETRVPPSASPGWVTRKGDGGSARLHPLHIHPVNRHESSGRHPEKHFENGP